MDPLDPLPYQTRTLPLENRLSGTYTIGRRQYVQGLAITLNGNPPTTTPATLPLYATASAAVVVDPGFFNANPDGFIIWFL